MATIRKATIDDLEAITEIYNEAILTTVATFDTRTKTHEEQRGWFVGHGPRFPIMVAEIGGQICGWASLSEWSDRCAYSDTAEISLYVKAEYRGRGLGKELLKVLLQEGEKCGLHTVIARIAGGNEASIRLHENQGFEHIGVMREVGRKFGRLIDVYLLQKIYKERGERGSALPSRIDSGGEW